MVVGLGDTGRAILRKAVTGLVFGVLSMWLQEMRPDLVDLDGRPRDVEDAGRQLRKTYDFVVVGAGSAGAVVASRLSEEAGWSVLLLEAGGDETLVGEVPVLSVSYNDGPAEWGYLTEPDPRFCRAMIHNRCRLRAGKVMGGTSSINGMIYARGNPRDYDGWADAGNHGWSFRDVLPYFKKSENMRVEQYKDSPYHGTGGYLSVEEFRYRLPMYDVLFDGIRELGHDILDVNGERQDGFMYSHGTLRNGFRCSTSKAFLRPVKDRLNLDISMRSRVDKLLIDPKSRKAQGVIFHKSNRTVQVSVRKEIIVSAGAIGSPKILMLSGVGPSDHLKELSISPIISTLNVGNNLQDHIALGGLIYTVKPQLGVHLFRLAYPSVIRDMLLHSTGPMMDMGTAVGFLSSSYANSSDYPDISYFLSPVTDNGDHGLVYKDLIGYTDTFYSKLYDSVLFKDAFRVLGVLMRPKSKGRVKLRDRDPASSPLIFPNFLAHPDDVKILVEAARFSQKLSETSPLRSIGAKVNPNKFPGCEHLEMLSDEYLECALRMYTFTLWHPAGTCKMGPATDPDAVVDSRLRVYGVQGVRVADASIMPTIITGNLNAPCIMIGEKVSDMIKEDWLRNVTGNLRT